MSNKARLVAGGAVVLLAAVLGLALCTGGGGNGGNGPGPGGSSESLRDQGARVARDLLAGPDAEPSIGSATGTVETVGQGAQPAVAEVLAVEVGPNDTLLRWRLKSTGPLLSVLGSTLGASTQVDARGVAVFDPSAQKLFRSPLFSSSSGNSCVCSLTPVKLDGKGQVLTGLYLPLPPGASRVEVRIPGFPPITDVPVKRG